MAQLLESAVNQKDPKKTKSSQDVEGLNPLLKIQRLGHEACLDFTQGGRGVIHRLCILIEPGLKVASY